MKIAGIYSFNNGEEIVREKYLNLLQEVEMAVSKIDALACKTKKSKEKTMPGQVL
jgi:hypothetical protein